MNKTMTRLLLWSILVMFFNKGYAQEIGGVTTVPGNWVCAGNSAWINAPLTENLNFCYQYNSGSGWVFCFGDNDLPYEFQVPTTGPLYEVQRRYTNGAVVVKTETVGFYYAPQTPVISSDPISPTSCGASDGRIIVRDVSANFATMPRNFILYNALGQEIANSGESGTNTNTFSGLKSGTYRVKITTKCTTAEQTVVVTGTGLDAKITGTSVLCLGTGTELTASGGTSYLWDNGATSSRITALPNTVGTHLYKVQVSDGTCTQEASFTVTVKSKPSAIIQGPGHTCYNGSVTLNASGTGTYAWSTGSTTSSINTSLLQSTQTYRLTVTDPNTQCSSVDEHVVNVLPRPTLNEAPNSICTGGSVNLIVSGGSSYSWNVGGTTASIVHSPSSSTEYRVTVTDANGCSYVLSKNISVTSPPSITFGGGTSICAGQSLNITAFGGSSYSWNYNSANTATITVSPTTNTTYTVTATSSGGCVASAERVITVKPSPTGNIDAPSSICPGQNVTLTASGGISYAWNGGASTASITVSPTQNTNYTVSISNTEGCTVVKSHAIAVNISGSASNDGPLTCSKTSVMLRATTGAAGASFSWRNVQGAEIATTATTTVSMPGVYNLEITGAGGCKVNAATEVVQNVQVPEVNANSSGMLTCVQSSVNLSGSSSVSPASYEWRNGSGTLIANTLNTSVTQAGTYTLKVSAANGCSSTASATVTADLTSPQVNVQHDGALTCTKTNAILSASSSTPGLQYTWKNAAGNTLGTGSSIQVNTSGTYWLEARGSNACMFSQSITLTQSGSLPTVNVSKSTSGCNFTLQGSSTTPGVTYAWSNQNGRVVATTPNFTTNQEGTYTLKVSTATGCSQQASINAFAYGTTVSISIDGASQGYLTYHKTNLTCTKNSVVLSANSSDAIESYFWVSPSGTPLGYNPSLTATQTGTYLLIAGTENGCPQTHEVLVERINTMPAVQITGDSTVCRYTSTTLSAYLFGADSYQWSNGSTSSTINTGSVSSDVIFEVTVTMGSCQRMLRRTVRVEGQAPGGSTAGPTKPCTHIPVTYSAAGGSAYKWSSGETTATISVPNGFTNTNWVGYWVDISDQYGCTTRRSFTVKPTGSPVVTVSGIPTAPFCAQASINLTASAGGAWGNYLWSTGETTTNLQKTLHESTALNLKFTASNGCVVTKSINVEVVPRPSPQILGGDIACAGDNTTLTATGGTSHLWNTNATTSSISINQPTQSQTYTVTASSMPGCTGVASKVVTVPAPLSLSYTLAGNDDCIPNNVTVIPTVSGGTGSIELSLAEVGTDDFRPVLNGLRSGNYVLKAKDSKGCEVTRAVSIDEAQELTLLANFGDERQICKGTSIELEAFEMHSGGTAPFTYSWNTGSSAASIEAGPVSDTNYSVSISDSKGCSKVAEILVMVLPAPEVEIQGAEAVCPGTVVVLESEVNGGISPFTYRWNTGASTDKIQISLTQNSTFTLTLTDAKGCEYIQSKTITLLPAPSPSDLTLSSQTQNHLSCAQPNANIQVSSSLSNLSYTWKNNAGLELSTGSNLVVNEAGTYWVEARNSSGCTTSKFITITQDEALPTLYLNTFPKVLNCDEGSIWVSGRSTTPGVRFEWRNAEGQLISTQAGFEAHYPGTFTLKAISTEGCANSITTQIEDDIYLNFDVIIDDQNEGQSKSFFSRTITCTKPNVKIDLGPLLVVSSGVENQKQNSIKLIDPEGNIQEINRLESIMLTQGGTYRIVWAVFDDECKRSKEIFVKDEREEILAEIEGETTICPGGTTTLSATGGSQFLWSTGATTSSIEVQVSQNSTYTVTVSKGSCSGEAEVEVLVHNPILLEHQLTGTDDCTPNNAVLIPSSSGGTGNIVWSLAKAGSTDFSSILNGLGSGDYMLKAKDANGCEVEKNLSIKETPATITELKFSGLNDCTPGNTQMEIVTTGDRLPLIYRLNGTVLGGKTTTLPRTAGAYTIEVEDAAGCVATETKTYPEHDVLQLDLNHVEDCNHATGSVGLFVPGWEGNSISSSLDGGQTWKVGSVIENLAPGNYSILVRNDVNGCGLAESDFELEGIDCPSLIGFTQSSITITSPTEIANLPLLVNYPLNHAEDGLVTLRLKGDGFPHFFLPDEEDPRTVQTPTLRAEEGIDRLLTYPAGFSGADIAAYPLSESAGQYLFPAVYTFTLREVSGSKLKVDPGRNTLRVTVRLGPPETVDEEVIAICNPDECPIVIGEDYGTGFCYSWDGPIAGDEVGKAKVSVCPSTETVYTQKILDINTFELVKLNTYRIKVGGLRLAITSNLSNHELCLGEEATLSAFSLEDGKLVTQTPDVKFQWSTGETTNPIKVKPAKNKNYSIYVTELKSGCVSKAEDYILVRNTPNVVVHPVEPLICKQGANYISTELKIANPTSGVTYAWSTGASGDKTLVNQPGEYTVTATTNAACKTEVKVLVEENTSNKALGQVGGEFYKFSADIAPQGVNSNPDFELGTGGTIENHTAFNDFTLNGVSLISSLEGILGSALFSALADQKILILDKSTSCRNPDILAKAKAEIIKHAVGFILFMDTDAGNLIHILGSNFKDRYTPISGDHVAFVNARLAYLQRQGLLSNKGIALHVVLNSLVDNFTASYSDIIAGFSAAEPGIVQPELRSDDPPGCKYDLDAATNFLTPAAVIVTLEQGATPFFGYKAEIADLAQAGALTWFTQNYLARVGRFWPTGFAGAVEDYYFIGYDNVTATPKNDWDLSIFPNSFAKDQEVKIWWANANGVDAVKVYELDYVNQKASNTNGGIHAGSTYGDGAFPKGGDVTTIKNPTSNGIDRKIVKSDRYVRFQVETKQPPVLTADNLTLWSIKTGKDYDRTEVLVDNSGEPDLTKGYIVNIPKDELDASKGFYQIYVKFYDNGQVPDYYYFDESQCKWNPYDEITDEAILSAFRRLPALKTLRALYDLVKAYHEASFDGGHVYFEAAGLLNPGFDVANAIWYFAEGRTADGVVSLIGAIPAVGDGIVLVKKASLTVGSILLMLIRHIDVPVSKLLRTISYIDDAGNSIEVVIDLKKIAEELSNSVGIVDLKTLLDKMGDPAFGGKEAADILKALENDPGIVARNYELLANSPLLKTDLEVLFKFEELIKTGVDRTKIQEALAGPFGDILNKAAAEGAEKLDEVMEILSSAFGKYGFSSGDFAKLAEDFNLNENLLSELTTSPQLIEIWKILSSSSEIRKQTEILKAIGEYLRQNPQFSSSIKTAFESLQEERRLGFISALVNASKGTLNITNARRTSPEEIVVALNRLRDFRAQGKNSAGNYGYLDGTINGRPMSEWSSNNIWASGKKDPLNVTPIWKASSASNTNGQTYLRDIDSEYKMLNDLGRKLQPNAVEGQIYPNHTGEITIVSELPYCTSCEGIIQKFARMFPNVKIILIDGINRK